MFRTRNSENSKSAGLVLALMAGTTLALAFMVAPSMVSAGSVNAPAAQATGTETVTASPAVTGTSPVAATVTVAGTASPGATGTSVLTGTATAVGTSVITGTATAGTSPTALATATTGVLA